MKLKTVILCAGLLAAVILLPACTTQPSVSLQESGQLRLCPKNPNCVSSESDIPMTQVEPIAFAGDPGQALGRMKEILLHLGGHVEKESDGYLWVTFRSKVLRYIDDVEVRLVPEQQLLHIRSGAQARLIYSDYGRNRERVRDIRQHFVEAEP